VIVPAAAAKTISTTLSRCSLMSALFGLASATLGVVLSSYVNLPAGPLVVIVGTVIFAGGFLTNFLLERLKSKRVSAQMHHA
jgi:ABC-type Mn2+/Zn2+ transport system permease subunit